MTDIDAGNASSPVVDGLPVGVYRNTPGISGRFLYANETMARILGYDSPGDLLGVDVCRFYAHPGERALFSEDLLRCGRVDSRRLLLKRKDGSPVWVRVSARVVRMRELPGVCVFEGVLHQEPPPAPMADEWADQTRELSETLEGTQRQVADLLREKSELEAQIRALQKHAAAGVLAAGLAHEVNNLNSGILGFSQVLLETELVSPGLQEPLERIVNISLRVREMTRGLLEFCRSGKQELVAGNLARCALGVVGLLRREYEAQGVTWDVELKPVSDTLLVEAQIGQVILNLLLNARQAVEKSPVRRIIMRAWETECEVCLSVRDTGCGIAPELHDKIFQPFFTTCSGEEQGGLCCGTGLGLSVSRMIVQRHVGTLRVESVPGRGAEFVLVLPRVECEARPHACTSAGEGKAAPGPDGKGAAAPAGRRVLVVDDEMDSCSMLTHALGRKGYHVQICTKASEGMRMALEGGFDLLLCDLQMPDVSGGELIRSLSIMASRPRVIVITGEQPELARRRLKQVPHEGVLFKPFELRELYELVESILSNKSFRP